MRMIRNRAAATLLGMAVAMACQTAFAQQIEEIVVTSRRQGEEKLMETPLAITAFNADAIEARGITSLQDVANLTPGLTFYNPFGENLPTPIIRGIVPQNIFGEVSAAIFIDGVYVAGREGLNFSQLDIDRIEVMKGPQTSSYGRNAFSGAINYVTRAPSDVFESKVEADVGNRGKQKISGQVSGPIFGDTLTGRVSMMYDEWDGSYDNTLAPENDIGGYRYRSFQGKLRWRPADDLDVNLSLYRSNDEIDESAVGAIPVNCERKVLQTQADFDGSRGGRLLNWCGKIPKLKYLPDMLDPATYPNPVPLPDSVRRDAMPKTGAALGEDRDLMRANLNIAWDTAFGTLSLLSGYSHLKQTSLSDFSRSAGQLPLVYCNTSVPNTADIPPLCGSWSRIPMEWLDHEDGSTVTEWSQELRFTSPRDQRLRWQAGGYFFRSSMDQRSGDPVGLLPVPGNFGLNGNIGFGPAPPPTTFGIGTYIFGATLTPGSDIDPLGRKVSRNTEKSWALFAATDFDITERLEGRVEARFTEDYKKSTGYNYVQCFESGSGTQADPYVRPDYPMVNLDPGCGNNFYDMRQAGARDYWLTPNPADPTKAVFYPGISSDGARFDNWTGRAGLKYTLDSGWMVYGSIGYGEKPGGLQRSSTVSVITPEGGTRLVDISNSFTPEKMTAYEIGIKGFSADRRMSLDLSAYLNDWRDIVLRQLVDRDPGSGLLFTMPRAMDVNAGDAHVFGWELEAGLAVTDNLQARLTTAFTDSKMRRARQDTLALFPSFYTDEPSCTSTAIRALPVADQALKASQCQALSGDISGKTQMRQPEWTASLSLDYKRQLIGDWDLKTSLSGNYTGKTFVQNDNQAWIPAWTNVNFNIGLESPRYTVQFWVRNLLDNDKPMSSFRDIYWTNDSDIMATVPAGTGNINTVSNFDDFPPMRMTITYPSLRTFGLTARMRFGGAEK